MTWLGGILFYVVVIAVTPSVLTKQCPLNVTVDITHGQRNGIQIIYDGLAYTKDDYYETNGTIFGCLCNVEKCIRKCCAMGKSVVKKGCAATENEEFEVYVFKKAESRGKGNFTYARSLSCVDRHGLYPSRNPNHEFFVQEDGRLYIRKEDRFQENDRFCVDMFYNSTNATGEFGALVCNDVEPSDALARIGMLCCCVLLDMPLLMLGFVNLNLMMI